MKKKNVNYGIWVVKEKKMVYPNLVAISNIGRIRFDNYPAGWIDQDYILMPYTILRAKKGRKLYEYDIVRHKTMLMDDVIADNTYVVEWKEQGYWNVGFLTEGQADLENFRHEVELLGNKFEHKELLKGK